MSHNKDTYDYLESTTGINFNSLYEKYKNISQNLSDPSTSSSSTSSTSTSISSTNKVKEDFNKLNKYKICMECQGQGIVKEYYNHRYIEKNCEACDGECILYNDKLEELKNELK